MSTRTSRAIAATPGGIWVYFVNHNRITMYWFWYETACFYMGDGRRTPKQSPHYRLFRDFKSAQHYLEETS